MYIYLLQCLYFFQTPLYNVDTYWRHHIHKQYIYETIKFNNNYN